MSANVEAERIRRCSICKRMKVVVGVSKADDEGREVLRNWVWCCTNCDKVPPGIRPMGD